MPKRRRPKGPGGGQFAPNARCEQIDPVAPLEIVDNNRAAKQWGELKEHRRRLIENRKYLAKRVEETQRLKSSIAQAEGRRQKRQLKKELRFATDEIAGTETDIETLESWISDLIASNPSLEDGPPASVRVDPYEVALHDRLTRIEAKRLTESTGLDPESIWDEAQRNAAVRVAIEPAHVTDADLREHQDVELPECPQTRPSFQEWTDAQEEASRLSYEYSDAMDEAVASGDFNYDAPELVAAREASIEATQKEIRLRKEYLGAARTPDIPSPDTRAS